MLSSCEATRCSSRVPITIRMMKAAAAAPTMNITLERKVRGIALRSPQRDDFDARQVTPAAHVAHSAPRPGHVLHHFVLTGQLRGGHGTAGKDLLLPVALHRRDGAVQGVLGETLADRGV